MHGVWRAWQSLALELKGLRLLSSSHRKDKTMIRQQRRQWASQQHLLIPSTAVA